MSESSSSFCLSHLAQSQPAKNCPSLLDTDVLVLMFGAVITFWQRSVSVAVGVSIEDTDVHFGAFSS